MPTGSRRSSTTAYSAAGRVRRTFSTAATPIATYGCHPPPNGAEVSEWFVATVVTDKPGRLTAYVVVRASVQSHPGWGRKVVPTVSEASPESTKVHGSQRTRPWLALPSPTSVSGSCRSTPAME